MTEKTKMTEVGCYEFQRRWDIAQTIAGYTFHYFMEYDRARIEVEKWNKPYMSRYFDWFVYFGLSTFVIVSIASFWVDNIWYKQPVYGFALFCFAWFVIYSIGDWLNQRTLNKYRKILDERAYSFAMVVRGMRLWDLKDIVQFETYDPKKYDDWLEKVKQSIKDKVQQSNNL